MDEIKRVFEVSLPQYVEDWKTYLRFQSVSAEESHRPDCDRCAEWLKDYLQKIGFKSEVWKTSGLDLVFGEKQGEPREPTILIYGHYDVQPPDPMNKWTSGPFEPQIRDEKMFARGAMDNKGQTFGILKALEYIFEQGLTKATVKVLIEGEEEIGSPTLIKEVERFADKLRADILYICDSGSIDLEHGALLAGLRGLVSLEARLTGPKRDLHSGQHGGLARNPAIEMCRLVASLHDDDGKIAIKGYYDEVSPVNEAQRQAMQKLKFTEEWYISEIGVPPTGGERGLLWAERKGLRPTVEVNGLYSGHLGEGDKTIIPTSATVKITSRLVHNQDSNRCLRLLKEHLEMNAPREMKLEFVYEHSGANALLIDITSPLQQKAKAILDEMFSNETVVVWEGGSIPVVPRIMEVSGAEPLLPGFGIEENNMHAPDESFRIEQLRNVFMFTVRFFKAL